jgi:hypothetical protein
MLEDCTWEKGNLKGKKQKYVYYPIKLSNKLIKDSEDIFTNTNLIIM